MKSYPRMVVVHGVTPELRIVFNMARRYGSTPDYDAFRAVVYGAHRDRRGRWWWKDNFWARRFHRERLAWPSLAP